MLIQQSETLIAKNPVIQSLILADDDDDDRQIFRTVLAELHQKIHLEVVSDGTFLMKLLQHYVPSLLFLDLEMPYKNGLECLVEIRGNEHLKDLPVVVFSSTTRPANIQTAYEMGAHLFLIKQASYQDYAASIKAILRLDWTAPEAIKEQYCINGRYAVFG